MREVSLRVQRATLDEVLDRLLRVVRVSSQAIVRQTPAP
jgi:hypothetical protein